MFPCGLNRTFMELKHIRRGDGRILRHRLNRTFMELKLLTVMTGAYAERVLIEPLWN